MSLLASYSFDEAGSTILDMSGNGRSWALASTIARDAGGHTNGGLKRSGTAGGAATVASTPFGQSTDNRSVMCWMKNPGNTTAWVLRWNVTSINSGSWGILLLNTQVCTQGRNAGGFARAACTRPTDGLWHHYAATYDGTNLKFYLDATLTETTALTAPMRQDAALIDAMEFSDTTTIIDDIRIYDETLTQAQISTLMSTPVVDTSTPAMRTSAMLLGY